MARHSIPVLAFLLLTGCTVTSGRLDPTYELAEQRVLPGVTVLFRDSMALIRNKRIALLTNQTGIDERGTPTIDLMRDARATREGVNLVMLFSPEHGIRGTEDRTGLPDEVDAKSGLPVISLYGRQTTAPPDSLMQQVDALVVDLQDIGTRVWTYVGVMVYSMRAAKRTGKMIIVLDRPNPITGFFVEGPMLDSALSNADEPTPDRLGQAYALHPMPLRHGMTMGEMALYYNEVLGIGANLKVVPMRGWRRELWFDRTSLPWVRPSPNMPSLQSAMLFPALTAFMGTNLSVGRGTPTAFQLIGAPWLKAEQTVALLREREVRGVRFIVEEFTPRDPTDGKYPGVKLQGIRILVTNRLALQPSRLGAALLWAITRTSGSDLQINERAFDRRFGSAALREAIMRGDDPDGVIDSELDEVFAFRESVRRYLLYR